jgi:hypothetical protein
MVVGLGEDVGDVQKESSHGQSGSVRDWVRWAHEPTWHQLGTNYPEKGGK